MKRKALPAPGFPPDLAAYDLAMWLDPVQWHFARWEYWQAHPEIQPHVDPVELLRVRLQARIAAYDGLV
jgi:hypothetical protein